MSTEDPAYAERLQRLSGQRWKQVLDVQRPYRWNMRRQHLGRTLDVGCGIGRNLASLPAGSVGVDHNRESIEEAKRVGYTAYTVEEWKALPAPEPFDSLLFAHVLEHLPPGAQAGIITEYLPYVRPGGTVFIICPQERGYTTDETHLTFLDGDALVAITREAGLEPVSSTSFPFPRFAGKVFTYNEFCVRARVPDRV